MKLRQRPKYRAIDWALVAVIVGIVTAQLGLLTYWWHHPDLTFMQALHEFLRADR